ncbi:putative microfibril-associated glycoprotein 4-like [Apostichopus japonicus]|uniref:Putative microfibril-associated glycoprotein 4-like n=1 Tax=Stichopus japonicus TaxID=307972 RepID=A0A2G8JVI7_STIJA|nr:putative microfibril-associated glycoprotein 4-like [Apostichopus japonicus]
MLKEILSFKIGGDILLAEARSIVIELGRPQHVCCERKYCIFALGKHILKHSYTTSSRLISKLLNYSLNTYTPESLITACPPNMVYETCSCQTTCEDPKGESGCHSDCIGSESCVCPTGFLMHGSDCTSASECGCFVPEVNFVVPNGELYINDRCTQKCFCNNNQLTCAVYRCSTDAVCNVKNGVRKCYCNAGYEGNGETCTTSSTDCKDVYDSGRRQDGVYTILPSRWPGLPFNVKCKMDNGGGWTKDYKLRFDVITSRGWRKYAEYAEFEVRSENDKYRMSKLGAHSGDTGDYLVARNRGKYFSTYDRDNDACGNFNCAEKHRSGWWHSNTYCSYCYGSNCSRFQYSRSCNTECTADNLNGDYNGGNGENIMSYASGDNCYVRSVEMKIRPRL